MVFLTTSKLTSKGTKKRCLRHFLFAPLLSFEFNRTFLDSAFRAIDNNIFADASFNYTLIDPIKFELQTWVSQSEIKRKIGDLKAGPGLGDIFVSLARRT